ncbi:sensor histidine kinase [Paraburkholderia sp. UCT70]|uniref:sensor histidine kinase n=1 Tax=Paraburkholderia sp. UCT70 TaxID=2991068 RepID=UPI003D24C00F
MKTDVNNGQRELHITVPPYPVTVHADPARLTQVVSNLLKNSVKYTPPGGDITLLVEAPDLSLGSTHGSSPRHAVITVRDNGAGIAPSLLPHVFEMFAQSPSARRHAEGGLGIGLAVVKHLVTRCSRRSLALTTSSACPPCRGRQVAAMKDCTNTTSSLRGVDFDVCREDFATPNTRP